MDEAEKYKQRLEAIAEKRRLQEEQERARREVEDERLRVQQLKRKSLRDQWLMEGAPLSPTSLDTRSRSPVDGSQDNQHMEKLSETAEDKDKLKVQVEDGQAETETLAEAEEVAQNETVQNGAVLESNEDEVKTTQSLRLNKTDIPLTNGTKDSEVNTNDSDSEPSAQSTSTNGPVCVTEGVVSLKAEPGLSLGVSEAEDDEDTVVMRAERVIITDEGDDASEKVTPQEGRQDAESQQEEPAEGATALTEQAESPGATAEAQPDDRNANGSAGGETKDDGQNKAPASTATAAPAPEPSQCSPEAEREAAASPGRPAAAQPPAAPPGPFQEVPLTDPDEKPKADKGAGEQEPLLLQTRAQVVQGAADIPAGTETRSGEQAKAAGHKSCQCCSIM
ncbi:paralemmin-3 isoform X2 [Betta splendens]|uniref:Paralemmin-3 isoform X2 n=1 Tax=Betta splendens TaxID=158456 RepID=A0A6P7N069_BETSP|nr:paralemmin-3 isoform X2 [Betta splendens]